MMGGGMLIGWLLLAGIVIIAVGGIDRFRAVLGQDPGGAGSTLGEHNHRPAPEEILRERHARGELSREEYLEALETLAS